MARFYLLCIVFFATCDVGRSISILPILPDVLCKALTLAVRASTVWKVDESRKIIRWFPPGVQHSDPDKCSCANAAMGLGSVSSIKVAASKGQKASSVEVCMGCRGPERAVTDYSFSQDDPMLGPFKNIFGPCGGVTVYRCSCSAPLTSTARIPTNTKTAKTSPLVTTFQPTTKAAEITTVPPVISTTIDTHVTTVLPTTPVTQYSRYF